MKLRSIRAGSHAMIAEYAGFAAAYAVAAAKLPAVVSVGGGKMANGRLAIAGQGGMIPHKTRPLRTNRPGKGLQIIN